MQQCICFTTLLIPHLLVRLEDVTSEGVPWHLPSDVTENLQVLGVVGHIENPVNNVHHAIISQSEH